MITLANIDDFRNFSLLYTTLNCEIRTCWNFRLTLNLLLHYLVKLEMLSVLCTMYDIWFITNGIVQIIVETRMYGIVFLCNLEWKLTATILSWSTAEGEAAAMHQGNSRWQFHIPTGQCTCAQRAWQMMTQSHFYAKRRQTLFLPTSGPQTAQIWTPWIIRSGL